MDKELYSVRMRLNQLQPVYNGECDGSSNHAGKWVGRDPGEWLAGMSIGFDSPCICRLIIELTRRMMTLIMVTLARCPPQLDQGLRAPQCAPVDADGDTQSWPSIAPWKRTQHRLPQLNNQTHTCSIHPSKTIVPHFWHYWHGLRRETKYAHGIKDV